MADIQFIARECCECDACLCGCTLRCLFYLTCKICNLIIFVGIFAFFFWLIIHPNAVKFNVTDASLTQFNFTNNNTLNYNLALNITIRNPNRIVEIYYDNIETVAFYKDVRFASQTLGTFFQHRKNTSFFSTVFTGQQVIPLSSDQILEFNKEKKDGVYGIDLKVSLNLRFKLGSIKKKAEPKVHCDLKFL